MNPKMKRDAVLRRLLDNARRVSMIKEDEVRAWGLVLANGVDFVPGYVPFVGEKYFHRETNGCRILAFALSQNLKEKDSFAQSWANDWARGGELALDRQNRAYAESQSVAMQPFDTGHIPVLAALLRSLVRERGPSRQESIYEQIAATNLSKFSFRTARGHTTDQPSSLQTCWEWFSKKEVNLLRPDYIICCGDLVYSIVKKEVADCCAVETAPKLFRVSFPSLRVINSHYGKKRWPKGLEPAQIEQYLTRKELDHPVKQKPHVREVVTRDAYYFMKMRERMKSRLSGC